VSPEPSIVIARGARAAEAYLLGELRRLHDAARADWALLGQPVRVVVPSRSLRDHLAARLVRELGGGAAGIAIQTLRALAFELLERAGEGARGGQALVPVLARRFAAAEPALADALGGFEDGFAVALATVNDLLDAGLDATNAESALECLAEAGPRAGVAAGRRAEALVRVAERVAAELAARGLEPRAGFFRRARERFEKSPALLPSRALFLHGWADVTGVQLDLVEALVRGLGGCVVLDHPPSEAGAGDPGPGERWTERLRLRLGARTREADRSAEAPALDAIEAPGLHAEARAVAERIRALLDAGAAPEAIGIVLRDAAPYRHALYAQLTRLGVPFSGSAASLGPTGRRIAALLELLERGDGCPADRWLDAQARTAGARGADLRLALHGIGVGRLRDVAALELDALLAGEPSYPLPVRRGLVAAAAPAGEAREAGDAEPVEREPGAAAAHARRRSVSRETLAEAIAAAGALRARLEELRSAPSLGSSLAALRRLLARELGWLPVMPAAGAVYATLAQLEQELGAEFELSADEGLVLLRRAFASLGDEPLGGAGGGVALLSALEARGRTFAQLYVMGLCRDVFPRLVREDPLFPDALRRALEAVLPDVPIKKRGEDEERYLFAALCDAAPAVTLTWPTLSDDGKERAVSPLVEALRTGGRLAVSAAAPVLAERAALRPAFEHAIRAGIAREPQRGEQALALALGAPAAAQARAAAVRALDTGGWGEPLGPFFGFVGAARPGDPRLAALSITRLEGLARCAWQAFLERVLGLEPPPDALAELPDASPLLVGNVVHAVLEELVRDAGGAVGRPIEEARQQRPVRVAWPAPDELERKLRRAAEHAAREEGIVLRGFAVHLARRARPLLARVRALDWGDGAGPQVLGAELEGGIEIARPGGAPRTVRFRADRGDLVGGGVVLVDYKTGAPISKAKTAATRSEHLLAQIAQGRRLQGPAYARAGRTGRYLFAKEGLDDENANVEIDHDDTAASTRFDEAMHDLLGAFERGAFPPRLLGETRTGKGPACERCDVAEACLLGESGSAHHLAAWITRHEETPERLPEAPRAALALLLRVEKK
jgi:RecB family exonuclease